MAYSEGEGDIYQWAELMDIWYPGKVLKSIRHYYAGVPSSYSPESSLSLPGRRYPGKLLTKASSKAGIHPQAAYHFERPTAKVKPLYYLYELITENGLGDADTFEFLTGMFQGAQRPGLHLQQLRRPKESRFNQQTIFFWESSDTPHKCLKYYWALIDVVTDGSGEGAGIWIREHFKQQAR